MDTLPYANSFRDLLVYQKARDLTRDIFRQSTTFPKEEAYSLTDQIRRSSRAIRANIAEAWAKRRYERHFISKFTDSDGEQQETQHWIDTAVDCGYWEDSAAKLLRQRCEEIGRMLGSMMNKADPFCGGSDRSLREAASEYLVFSSPAIGSPSTDHS